MFIFICDDKRILYLVDTYLERKLPVFLVYGSGSLKLLQREIHRALNIYPPGDHAWVSCEAFHVPVNFLSASTRYTRPGKNLGAAN